MAVGKKVGWSRIQDCFSLCISSEQLSSGSGSDPSPDSDGSNWKTNPAVAAVSGQHNLKTESPTKCILNNHKMEERKRQDCRFL